MFLLGCHGCWRKKVEGSKYEGGGGVVVEVVVVILLNMCTGGL